MGIWFVLFVGELAFETGHMVPPLYWRICILEILLFGDLEISFIYRYPCPPLLHLATQPGLHAGGGHGAPAVLVGSVWVTTVNTNYAIN